MPEGPEIRLSTDALAKVLSDKVVLKLSFEQPHLRAAAKSFKGKRVLGVEPRGKAVLTHFEHSVSIYSHNQLYGQWAIFAQGAEPASHKLRRIVIDTAMHRAVLYSASDIEVLATANVAHHPYIFKLGVELLDPHTTVLDVLAQINLPRWQNKLLAQILLDQAFLAGIGNYLRSEILYEARLHPELKIRQLSDSQKKRLATAALAITRRAYRAGGITNQLARAKKLQKAGVAFAQYRHHVFDRPLAPCWTCSTTVQRIMLAGRQLYWCPSCQGQLKQR